MVGVLFVVGTGLTFAVFGALLPALAVGAFAATYPVASLPEPPPAAPAPGGRRRGPG